MSDKPTGSTDQADHYTYATDVHCSISQLIDTAGNVKASYGYTPYGGADAPATDNETLTTGDTNNQAPLNPYRYTGKRLDSGTTPSQTPAGPAGATGYDMGARRYGPDINSFLQQDQFHGALANLGLALDPLTQNRYALAGGNPISYIETDGHIALIDGGGGGSYTPTPTNSTSTDSPSSSQLEGDRPQQAPSQRVTTAWEAASNISDFLVGPLLAGPEEIGGWGTWAGKAMHSQHEFLRKLGAKFNASLRHRPVLTALGRFARSSAGTWAGRASAVAGGVLSFGKHRAEGDQALAAGAKAGLELGGAFAFAKAGAIGGAALGSVVPGVGTAAGAFVGGIIGAGVGAWTTSEFLDTGVGDAVESGANAVQQWGGQVVEDAGDLIKGLFD